MRIDLPLASVQGSRRLLDRGRMAVNAGPGQHVAMLLYVAIHALAGGRAGFLGLDRTNPRHSFLLFGA